MLPRAQALLAALWGGFLLCVAFVAAPNAFAVLEKPLAAAYVARLFEMEAGVSLVAALLLMLIERRLARDATEAGQTQAVFSVRLLLPALAMFCTVAGYYGLQPLMAQARAGTASVSFALLHGASMALFAVKGLAVLALAWISQSRAS